MVVFLNWNGESWSDIVYHPNENDEVKLPSSPVELFFLTASVVLRSCSTLLGTVVMKLGVWVSSADVERVVAVSPVLNIAAEGVVMLVVVSVVLWLSLLGLFLRLYWISPRASSPCAVVEKEPVLMISTVSGVWDDGYVSPHELPSVSGTRLSPEKFSVEMKTLGSGVWVFCSGISVTTTQLAAVAGLSCAGRLVWLSLGPSLVAFGGTVVGTTELVGGKEVINLSVTVEGPGSHERLHHDINPIETTSAVSVNYK